ncbi:Iron-sulfur assembly protein 1 [Rhodotorula kratochvilovae]
MLRASTSTLRTALRARAPAVASCPACARLALPLPRHLSTALPLRAPILDQTPSPAVHPAPIPPAPPRTGTAPARKRTVRARKAALSLTPGAVDRIRSLLDQPEPKLIRVGVRNKGCAGMSYHLEYVDKADKFDEVVEQDGVKVVIDSRALFSVIGSEMDWQEDALQARFVFNNPNIKDACGCGESFIV